MFVLTGGAARTRKVGQYASLLTLAFMLGAPADADDAPPDVVARRGTMSVTASDLRTLLDLAEPAARAQIQANAATLTEFARERLLRQTVLAEAKAAKWDERPDVIARMEEARDTAIVQSYLAAQVPPDPNFPSNAEIAAAYEANKARFTVPKQFHVAQIALPVPVGASKETEEQIRKKLADLRLQLTKGKADFADLARKNSQDKSSADKGGDLGWVPAERLLPPLRDAVAALPDNGLSEVVRGGDSYHLVKLLGTRPQSVAPLEQVREGLVQALRQNRSQLAVRNYIEGLLKTDPIQVNDVDLVKRVGGAK